MRARALFVDPDGLEIMRDIELAPNNAFPRKWIVRKWDQDKNIGTEVAYRLEEKWEQTPAPKYGDPLDRVSSRRFVSRRYVRA